MLLLTGQVGIGLRALFTPKVLYSSEIIDGKKNFCNGHTVGILLFRRSGVLFMGGAVGVGEGWGGVRGWGVGHCPFKVAVSLKS